MKKKYGIGLIIVVLIGGYFWYRSTKNTTGTIQYISTQAEKGSLITSVSGSGNIVVDQLATVDPTITGTVANVAVNVGDTVKKGQLLFTIINDDLTASTVQSSVALQSAQIGISQAKANLYNAQHSSGDTERDRDILRSKIGVADQNLTVAQINYKNALSDSAKRQVISPIDGTVNAINIKNGDDLARLSSNSSNQAPIIIGDLTTLKAQVQVNEIDISNVILGQKVTLTFNSIPGLTVSGKVEKIDALGTISQGVVTYNITIGLDTIDDRLRPGMSVSANIITNVQLDVITVPNSAIKVQNGNTSVQVLGADGIPKEVSVRVGAANNTDSVITSGVNAGDKVVTRTILPGATTPATNPGGSGGIRIPGLGGGGRGG